MANFISLIWQYNLELSFILIAVLVARYAIRKTTKNYNAYLLWIAIPVGYGFAMLLKSLEFNPAKSEFISNAVQTFTVLPTEAASDYSAIGWLWLLVAFGLLCRLAWQHKKLRKQLKAQIIVGNVAYPNSEYPVMTIENEDLSPAVYGFIFPKIYFPIHVAKELTQQQRRLIIEHEQHHIKQKHLWLNLLWDLAVCMAWFNPLIYISRQQFRHDQELFCDYLVLNKSVTNQSASQDQKAYGHALLSTVSATASVSLLCSWKMFNQLEERIMNISKPMNFSGKIALIVGGSFIIGCSALYAANKESPDTSENTRLSRSVTHYDDGTSESLISWYADGVTYGNDNGYFYIVDKSGNKRQMTEKEKREFEKTHEKNLIELADAEEEMKQAQHEMEQAQQEMKEAQHEMELVHEEMEQAQKEIEKAHTEMERVAEQQHMSAEERHVMEREFEKAQMEINKAHKEMGKAQKEMEKSQREIQREVEKLRKNTPKPPKSSAYRTPPKPPVALRTSALERTPAKAVFPINPQKAPAPVVPIKTAAPKYPVSAMKNGVEGFVRFEFDVMPGGKLENISVIESEPAGVFEEAAQEAIEQWEFADSETTYLSLNYKIDFVLHN